MFLSFTVFVGLALTCTVTCSYLAVLTVAKYMFFNHKFHSIVLYNMFADSMYGINKIYRVRTSDNLAYWQCIWSLFLFCFSYSFLTNNLKVLMNSIPVCTRQTKTAQNMNKYGDYFKFGSRYAILGPVLYNFDITNKIIPRLWRIFS